MSGSTAVITGGNISAESKGLGNGIVITQSSTAYISGTDISACTKSEILVDNGSNVTLSAVIGITNAKYGVEISRNSKVTTDTAVTNITGALGDVKVGSNPVTSWSNDMAVSDFTNTPSQFCTCVNYD